MTLIAGGHGTGTSETHATTEYDAWPLIPETVSREVQSGIVEGSAALSMFRRLPNMSSRTHRLPVLSTLGAAEFTDPTLVTDDLTIGADQQVDDARMLEMKGQPYGTGDPGIVPDEDLPGLKPTHQMKWENVFVVAEPIAIILPIPEDVLDDSEFDMWAEMRPRIIEAFDQRIDSAIIWGRRRPRSWPTGVVPTALARGQVIAEGAGVDLGEDTSNLMGILEQQAYDPTGFIAAPSVKASLRNIRDSNNALIFNPSMQQNAPDLLWGKPISYIRNNTFQTDVSRLITGKMDEALFSIRSDMRWKIFTEGVITDENGRVIINLMQQDMVAMRVVMRLGWAVPNPIHKLRPDRAGYPFAVMTA